MSIELQNSWCTLSSLSYNRIFNLRMYVFADLVCLCFTLNAECCREASYLFTKLDCYVCDKFVCSGVGSSDWIWVRWMGQRDQLCQASWHIWALCQVLSVQTSNTTSSCSSSSLKLSLNNMAQPLSLSLTLHILYHTWGSSNISPTCDVCWFLLFHFYFFENLLFFFSS